MKPGMQRELLVAYWLLFDEFDIGDNDPAPPLPRAAASSSAPAADSPLPEAPASTTSPPRRR